MCNLLTGTIWAWKQLNQKEKAMGKEDQVYVFMGSYASEADAESDYKALKELHSQGKIGTYDVAVVSKDAEGNVHVHKHEKPTQHGTWWGIATGAAVGILFPPAIIPMAAAGGVSVGLISHLARGMSRKDMHELGETLDAGKAALIVVGRQRMYDNIDQATPHAQKKLERPVNVAADDFEKEMSAVGTTAS
jgi:uncharacterized membrane protein